MLVNYRKAPENRYPVAVEDAWSALCWVNENLASIAHDHAPLIVARDSAGGTLAAVVARRARDARSPSVEFQVLVYPVTDAGMDTASYRAPENQLLLSRDTMVWFWDHYVDVARRFEPDASPLRSSSLAGLPPALVMVAEQDVLRSEGEAYAAALAAADVAVDLRVAVGQMHGFFTMVNILPGSAIGLAVVGDAIAEHLAHARTKKIA